MEQKEFIYRASQARKIALEAGFLIDIAAFMVGRIYRQDKKDSGYVCFIAKVMKDNVPTYFYVKAFDERSSKDEQFAPVKTTKVVEYPLGHSFVAMGTTVWRYIIVPDDRIIINETIYRTNHRDYSNRNGSSYNRSL